MRPKEIFKAEGSLVPKYRCKKCGYESIMIGVHIHPRFVFDEDATGSEEEELASLGLPTDGSGVRYCFRCWVRYMDGIGLGELEEIEQF